MPDTPPRSADNSSAATRARVTLGPDDVADTWHLVLAQPSTQAGQWVGADGPVMPDPILAEEGLVVDGALRWGSYGFADAGRVVVGRLGEIAVDRWFKLLGEATYPLFAEDRFRAAADLVVNPVLPVDRHPRFARWLSGAHRDSAMSSIGEPLARVRAGMAARLAWVEQHGTTGPVTVEKVVARPGHNSFGEVWPSDSVEIVDSDGSSRRVRYETLTPPPPPAFADLAVEVKTWSVSSWPVHGRRINADQLLRIVDKAEVVVWCRLIGVLPDAVAGMPAPDSMGVELVGWSSVRDLVELGEPLWVTPYRAQLHIPGDRLRPMTELTPEVQLTLPTWPRRTARRLHGRGACGHRTIGRLCWTCAWTNTFPGAAGAPSPEDSEAGAGKVTVSTGNARFFHAGDRERVVEAHGRWSFTSPTYIDHVAAVCLSLAACPACLPAPFPGPAPADS